MRPGQTAPECRPSQQPAGLPLACFNEAGADCPGMPNTINALGLAYSASMRPGQTAPECARAFRRQRAGNAGFNEAGADCPGMQLASYRTRLQRRSLQ